MSYASAVAMVAGESLLSSGMSRDIEDGPRTRLNEAVGIVEKLIWRFREWKGRDL
jgi:hypothetical protein